MIHFLLAIPQIVLYGCVALIIAAAWALASLVLQKRRASSQTKSLADALRSVQKPGELQLRQGLSLASIEDLRARCERLDQAPREWWSTIDAHIEQYTSPQELEGWFLSERPRNLLPYEIVIGKYFNSGLFGSIAGLLTAAGLTLTFIAILFALYGVHYDKSNAADPITGIDVLINGLSGKFVSSIVALLLSIFFTLIERRALRTLRARYEHLLSAISEFIPYLSSSRILLDIQRFAAQQTVSVSHISSEVVDRLVGAFNTDVVPALAIGMSDGVAEKLQSEFRPTMERMNGTLESLKAAIVGLESGKQESITGEIRGLMTSLETSLVAALSKMGDDFHSALTGAANREFGNVQGTLEATRQMLSDMNTQFGAMQAAFSAIIEKAEQSTSDQMKTGREQTEALTALMNGLMLRMQESADQNLSSVRSQLTMVVSDLTERVGTLSQDMMAAADNVAKQAQKSASDVVSQTGEWSEATAKRLESLLASMEVRSTEFQKAGQSLMRAQDFITSVLSENANALKQMVDASGQVKTYSTALAGNADKLTEITRSQLKITAQLGEASGGLRAATEQNDRILGEYRRTFDGYKSVIEDLDNNLGKILKTLQSGLHDYNQALASNYQKLVNIANPMVSQVSSFLQTQIDELSGQLEELSSVLSKATDGLNGRIR